jgi:hypothetical protein
MNIFHQAFGASTPADRLILTFVSILLFAVSWQTVAHIMHKLSVAKRKRDLFYAMAEGVELKVTAHPTVGEEFGNTGRWCRDVQQWVHHTGTMLGKYSAQAGFLSGTVPIRWKHLPAEALKPVLITKHSCCG